MAGQEKRRGNTPKLQRRAPREGLIFGDIGCGSARRKRLRPPEHHEEAKEQQPELDLGPKITRSAPTTGQKAQNRQNAANPTRAIYSGAFSSPSTAGYSGGEEEGVTR
jgi:hypothetical protein